MSEIDYNSVGWIVSSKYRKAVMQNLHSGPKIPTEIAENSGDEIAHISRALADLSERNMVELLVDESTKKGRLYGTTDKGEDLAEIVVEREQ